MANYLWRHDDSRTMSVAVEAAIKRASLTESLPKWPKGDANARADLRALMVATLFMVDALSKVPAMPGTDGRIVIGERARGTYSSDERVRAASVLLETWRTLVVADTKSNAPPDVSPQQFQTLNGGPAEPVKSDAGFGWPVAAVAIVGVTIQAGVICYCADKVATVIDNELSRREATQQMIASQGNLLAVLMAHKAKEEAAGTDLPLGDAEKATINALGKSQVEAQKGIKGENPSLFPDVKKHTGKIIDAATNLGWGALAIAGLLVYVFIAKGK